MNKIIFLICLLTTIKTNAQQALFMPQNILKAYANETRSMDGKQGKNYWQNTGNYTINVSVAPPSKTVQGNETITYINNSPKPISNIVIKLIMNIHSPGASRQSTAAADYLTTGIHIDQFMQNGKESKFRDPKGNTWTQVSLTKPVATGDSVQLSFKWHYDLSEQSGREGKLDSTSFFLAYFYPRVAVLDDTHGWDRMDFTDAQEFYNDFNNYTVAVTVPKNYLVWGTGDLLNPAGVLQPSFLEKFNKSFTSDEVINIVTQKDIEAKNITTQNETNTWKWKASNISDMAYCISDHYVWDAASVLVDKKTGLRSSCQSAFLDGAKNFHNQVRHIQHSFDWYSNNWPGVAYPFPKSTIIQGFADMEYPMMANDNPLDNRDATIELTDHEIFHTMFPFYMGINETKHAWMDEGWATIGEWLISSIIDSTIVDHYGVRPYENHAGNDDDLPIITPTTLLNDNADFVNSYPKPAFGYLFIKDMLGDELFTKALHYYIRTWQGKHPIPYDFFNCINTGSGKNLNWFWKRWFFDDGVPDLAITAVRKKKNTFTATVASIGTKPVPIDLTVYFKDGGTQKIHRSIGVWEKNNSTVPVTFTTDKSIQKIVLGSNFVPDVNKDNNVYYLK